MAGEGCQRDREVAARRSLSAGGTPGGNPIGGPRLSRLEDPGRTSNSTLVGNELAVDGALMREGVVPAIVVDEAEALVDPSRSNLSLHSMFLPSSISNT